MEEKGTTMIYGKYLKDDARRMMEVCFRQGRSGAETRRCVAPIIQAVEESCGIEITESELRRMWEDAIERGEREQRQRREPVCRVADPGGLRAREREARVAAEIAREKANPSRVSVFFPVDLTREPPRQRRWYEADDAAPKGKAGGNRRSHTSRARVQ
jgi:hypothetical protein